MKINGFFLDGETSKQTEACLEVLEGSDTEVKLTLRHDGYRLVVRELDLNDIRIESRLGNTPREVTIEQECLFTTEDNHGIDQLAKLVCKRHVTHSLLHRIESNLIFVLAGIIICCLTSWATVVYGVPKAAQYMAFQMPDFIKHNLGSSMSVLDKTLFKPSEIDEDEQARIQALMSQYNQTYKDLNPSLHFRLGMGANAFALPSGDIVFTDDFVKLAKTDDELRAVYFHELGHLAHKHMTRRAIQGAMLSITILLITGDIENFDLIVGIPVLLTDLSYSRDFEREADEFAFETMSKHDVPVNSFGDVMQRLEAYYEDGDESDGDLGSNSREKPSWLQYMSTHPGTKERIERMQALSSQATID